MINALGNVLKINDVRMLAVALEGLENTLKCGDKNFKDDTGQNLFALMLE